MEHVVDSINIGLGGKFATWAGTLLDRDRPIAIIAEPGRQQEAAMRLGRIGFDHVASYLKGGMQALDIRPDLVRRTERVTTGTLTESLTSPQPPLILDMRTEREGQEKRIEERIDEVPRDRPPVVHCQTGYRTDTACSKGAPPHGRRQASQ
jgi:rhodanese-related sulfurtransferase